ncbi:Asp-tRNA(Asn)/Glu-tRNA(Gln) amidotransferase subunit GatB, partial [Candidatus Saccharibacteria bacterium]|nr:Asp-tRNA(Asn)/Glu-tRNA(Gln) amidotransferase subunit GatB [Candidatus Saccharibacteria bacterium]
DRKHYFYPDLPKGYQTTQLYHPIIGRGKIDVPLPGGEEFSVRIHHAHLEEDAGKLTHPAGREYSLVDLNRAGTPLIEIVSEADIHSAEQAKAYAQELYLLMTYAGVTHGDLYHGNMRFDVNVSVAKKGSKELGKRTEVKNLNSFKSVERAAEYEINRQIEILEKGDFVTQETRGWNDAKQKTFSQRSKEEAQDYRYMPDADIPPVVLDDIVIESAKSAMPMLPPKYREKWEVLGVDSSVINALLQDKLQAKIISEVQDASDEKTAKRVAHWFASALVSDEEKGAGSTTVNIPLESLIELSKMVEKNELSSTAAKEVFLELLAGNKSSAKQIAEEKNLLQVSDEGAIAKIVDDILAEPASQKAVQDVKAGNDKAIGFLVGQVMKQSKGKANPALAQKLIRERI